MLQQFGELAATIGPWFALVALCVPPVWCYFFARMVLKTLRLQGQTGVTVKARTFPLPHVEVTIDGPAAEQLPAADEPKQLPASKPQAANQGKRSSKRVGKP